MKLPHIRDVQFDLGNWFISRETGEFNIVKGKKCMFFTKRPDGEIGFVFA
jgi:hypothetical protein